jgi:hypothetical protein
MKRVFICSAFRGNTEENIRKAKEYCRWAATKCGVIPIAPHLLYPQFLDDENTNERELGIRCGLELLSLCDELWYFGTAVTKGMEAEIAKAHKLGIPVRYVTNAEFIMNQRKENGGMFYV